MDAGLDIIISKEAMQQQQSNFIHNQQEQPLVEEQEAAQVKDDDDDPLSQFSNFHAEPVLRYLEKELSSKENFHIQDSKLYQQANCVQLPKDRDFCPAPDAEDAWRLRMPGFMIIGAKKAGTTSLWQSMTQHPDIVGGRVKELLFFTQVKFDFENYTQLVVDQGDDDHHHRAREIQRAAGSDKRKKLQIYSNSSAFQVKIFPTRADLLQHFPRQTLQQRPSATSLDATPEYLVRDREQRCFCVCVVGLFLLFVSWSWTHSFLFFLCFLQFNFPTSIKAIMCTCPWIKIIIILRHPTDRVWSHYNFLQQTRIKQGKTPIQMSFEEFVLDDAKRMSQLGLGSFKNHHKNDDNSKQESMTDAEMVRAWFEYKQSIPEGESSNLIFVVCWSCVMQSYTSRLLFMAFAVRGYCFPTTRTVGKKYVCLANPSVVQRATQDRKRSQKRGQNCPTRRFEEGWQAGVADSKRTRRLGRS
jgi:Sulfotransferase family